VGSGRRVTRWVLVTVGAFAVLLGVSGSPALAEPAGLAAQVQPMFSPDPQDSLSCTSTQIDLTRQDGTPFNDGDRLKVETQLAYNDPVAVQLDMWSIEGRTCDKERGCTRLQTQTRRQLPHREPELDRRTGPRILDPRRQRQIRGSMATIPVRATSR